MPPHHTLPTLLFLSLLILNPTTSASTSTHWTNTGCGIDHSSAAGGPSFNATIQSSGGLRSFLIHIPSTYTSHNPTPMVLSYHGNSRTATYQEQLSQFSNATFNPDWIAVYPQGVGNSWQGPSYATPGVSDIQFTADLLTYMTGHFCIDSTRIYATGKSNGGGFVDTLACSAVGGRFAAFAPVSGAFYTDANASSPCEVAQERIPVPMLEFHGADDTTIPYAGGTGKGGDLPAIPAWLQRWAERDDCAGANVTTEEYGGVVSHSVWTCRGVPGVVQGYKIQGLAHIWPATVPNLDNKGNVTVLDATRVIMDFFARFRNQRRWG